MTIGTSIFLIVVGAILRYAVTWTVANIDLHTVGLILIIAGVFGLILSLIWMFQPSRRSRAARPARRPRRRPAEPVDEPPYGAPYEPRSYDDQGPYDDTRAYDETDDGRPRDPRRRRDY